jgi:hypothetical protein
MKIIRRLFKKINNMKKQILNVPKKYKINNNKEKKFPSTITSK